MGKLKWLWAKLIELDKISTFVIAVATGIIAFATVMIMGHNKGLIEQNKEYVALLSNANELSSTAYKNALKPYLTLNMVAHSPTESPKLEVVNAGPGPAIIDSIKLYHNKKLIEGDYRQYSTWDRFVKEIGTSCDVYYYTLIGGIITPYNSEKILHMAEKCKDKKERQKFIDYIHTIGVLITYRSIYDEKFTYEVVQIDPTATPLP